MPVVAAFITGEMPRSMGERLRETLTTDVKVRMSKPVSASAEANQPDSLAVQEFETAEELDIAEEIENAEVEL